jgi:hypothetical protein
VNHCTSLEPSNEQELAEKKVLLGPKTYRRTLILDMDETILSSETTHMSR